MNHLLYQTHFGLSEAPLTLRLIPAFCTSALVTADYRLSVVRTFTGSRRKISEFGLAEWLENRLQAAKRSQSQGV
jgi:hypothetical protein